MVIDAFYVCDVQFFSAYNFISNKQTLPDNPCYKYSKKYETHCHYFQKKEGKIVLKKVDANTNGLCRN